MRTPYKVRKVIKEVRAPSQYSGRIWRYHLLECGHYTPVDYVKETSKAIRLLFLAMSGEPMRRRCYQCTTGRMPAPQISLEWLEEHKTKKELS